jgi:hypothetical protein
MKFDRTILIIFILCSVYILSFELILIDYPALNSTFYRLGKFVLNIAYSLAASSIFYFVAVFLPMQAMRKKVFSSIYKKTLLIDERISHLFSRLEINIGNGNYQEVANEINEKFKHINPDLPIAQ